MSIGSSGRIVIEVDPALKKDLYSALAKEGLSLKEWFLRGAAKYIENGSQLPLKLTEQTHGDQFLAGNNEKNKTQ